MLPQNSPSSVLSNGLSFFPFAKEDDSCEFDLYAKTRTSIFELSFVELVAALMTDRQRKQLRKLIDFRFTRDCNYNLPAKRLKMLEAFIQWRIRNLSMWRKCSSSNSENQKV